MAANQNAARAILRAKIKIAKPLPLRQKPPFIPIYCPTVSPLLQTRLTIAFFFLLHGFVAASWVSRIPAVSERLELKPAVLGAVLVANMLGTLLGTLLIPTLIGWFGSRRVVRVASVSAVCCLFLVALMPEAVSLFLGLLVMGYAASSLNIAMNSQATALEALYKRPIVSSFHAIWSFGALLGSLSGAALANLGLKPWAHFLVVAAVLAGLALWVGRFLLPTNPVSKAQSFSLPLGPLFLLGLMGLCAAISDGSIPGWSGVYLRSLGSSETVAALGFAMHQGAMIFGRLGGDWLSLRFGPHRVARIGALIGGLGLAIGVSAHSISGLFLGIACMGLGMGPMFPLMFVAASKFRPQNPAVAIASVSSMSTLGGILGPPLLGQAAQLGGIGWAFGVAALLALAVSGLSVSLNPARIKNLDLEQ